jgi:hypothetical protein
LIFVAASLSPLFRGLFFGGGRGRGLVFDGGYDFIVVFKLWWAKRLAEVGLGSPDLLKNYFRKNFWEAGIYQVFYGWLLMVWPIAKTVAELNASMVNTASLASK